MKVCVFCGSSMGYDKCYRDGAAALGEALANGDNTLLYGGGAVGLMKIIADTMLEHGREVIGVMPRHLIRLEVGHGGITEMIETDTMAERKMILEEKADAFIAMPGGFGTLDELFEVVVLDQLRFIEKPVALFNINHYFDKLVDFIKQCVTEGFIRQEHFDNVIISDDPNFIIEKMRGYRPVTVGKWIEDIHEESKEH